MSKYYDTIKDARNEWRNSQPNHCMYCVRAPCGGFPLEVHEIERRSQAPGRWAHPCNYLLLCHFCHADHFDTMCHPKQLAVKLKRDPDHFDLEEWLRIRDKDLRAPDRVTLKNIVKYMSLIEWKS